ncbi:RodZ domain-containing protein [Halomonas saccharevitans]|uniref:Cytoskeleton protein RodZ n=1 Tax=Halomonas saccharevitans TaxID=416872 RepID=A0A1I7AZR9_9GAMM|nr:RodZ domain-containing protein [Halomonas saccharevitans]SFT80427.1 cytoskeleton protein RodZ [Halomonas saccharevitans]
MSDTHNDDAAETPPRLASPGELLRRERESQGLARDEVADALNLRPAVIQGLESDSYEEVPVPAYRRGYLRSYAQLLGIDDREVLEAYKTHFGGNDAEQRVTPVQLNRPPSRLGAWLFRLVTLLVIAGMIGLTLMWWQSRGGSQPPTPGDSGPVAVDSLDGSTTITEDPGADADELPPLPDEGSDLGLTDESASEAPSSAAADDEAQTTAAESDASAVAGGETPSAQDSVATAAESAETTGEGDAPAAESADVATSDADEATETVDAGVLELTFNEQSWTEIFDADNQRIFVGLQQPGTSARVEGTPPFRLTVGNATGVELSWGGEPVDLTARAGANNVARFTLGE